MEPPGARPGGRSRPVKESSLSRGPSRGASKGGLGAQSGTSMEGEDWDAMVKSFLKAEIERTEQRQDWLREKLEAAKDLADDDPRGDGYQARGPRRNGCARASRGAGGRDAPCGIASARPAQPPCRAPPVVQAAQLA
jgi:hypothetical protein